MVGTKTCILHLIRWSTTYDLSVATGSKYWHRICYVNTTKYSNYDNFVRNCANFVGNFVISGKFVLCYGKFCYVRKIFFGHNKMGGGGGGEVVRKNYLRKKFFCSPSPSLFGMDWRPWYMYSKTLKIFLANVPCFVVYTTPFVTPLAYSVKHEIKPRKLHRRANFLWQVSFARVYSKTLKIFPCQYALFCSIYTTPFVTPLAYIVRSYN